MILINLARTKRQPEICSKNYPFTLISIDNDFLIVFRLPTKISLHL